ncbi:MAG: nuclear transport factor 2 family protein [Thermoleophilaceae bacterium]
MARRRRAAAVVAVAALALCGGGCSDAGGDPEAEIRAALETVRTAFAAGDLDTVCALLARSAVREVGSIGHSSPTDCWADASTLADRMASVRVRAAEPPRIAAVQVAGDRATAITVMGRGSKTRVRLARENGRWKLATLFGSGGGEGRAGVGRGRDSATARCGPVTVRGRSVRGGCAATATARDIDFTLLSVLGASAFARCGVRMDLHADGRGRVWAANVDTDKDRFPCNDIAPCSGRPGVGALPSSGPPWRGRVRGSGARMRLELDVCLDTCIGRFEGRTRLRLVPAGRRWAMWVRGAVGLSGLELEGEWELDRGEGGAAWPTPSAGAGA